MIAMRSRSVYYCAMSLDGFIAESDDTIDWLTGYQPVAVPEGVETVTAAFPEFYAEFYEGIGALVSGSVTYEWILEHGGEWPYSGKPYWVLSSRELPVPDGEEV